MSQESPVQRKQRGSHRGRRFAQQTMSSVSNNDLARRLRRKGDETRTDDTVTSITAADDHPKRDRKRRQSVPHRRYRARTQAA